MEDKGGVFCASHSQDITVVFLPHRAHTIPMNFKKLLPFLLTILVAFAIIFFVFPGLRSPEPVMELPQGEQQVTGVLQSVPLSPTRRGTHMLEVDGEAFAFVEASRSLRSFEGLRVTVTGTFEKNIDPDLLPVIIAADVRTKTVALKPMKSDTLGIGMNVPEEWQTENDSEGMTFRVVGVSRPVLTVGLAQSDELPTGTSIVVAGRSAVRQQSGSGETVYLNTGKAIVFFDFLPVSAEEQDRLQEGYVFRQVILPSVTVGSSAATASSSAPAVSGSGAGIGQPCGGEAGVLCPAGQYCEIIEGNSGHCKSF